MAALSFAAHRDAVAGGRFLRVANYHNTPASGRDRLCRELAALSARYVSLGPADLDRFFSTGDWGYDRPGFLPVFYEGYRNSVEVAAEVCEELGLTGWFFICTAFVDCPPDEQEAFARSHFIGLLPEELGADRLAMSWPEIVRLSRRHVVTPHTAAHAGIADVVSDQDLDREVAEPKRRMDAATGQSAPAFAWLHGSPYGVSARHDEAVRRAGYRYLFSNTMVQRLAR